MYPSEVKEKPAESGTRVAAGSTARGHRHSGLSQSEPNPPKGEITAACSDCPGGRRGQTDGRDPSRPVPRARRLAAVGSFLGLSACLASAKR